MLKRVFCEGELHMTGGEGALYLADVTKNGDELLDRLAGSARVVYMDPPFGTGGSFEFRRNGRPLAYTDSLSGEDYKALIRQACELARAMLADDGTLFLHIDCRKSAVCRMILDEVFGEGAFTNEIIWAYKSGGRSKKSFAKKHDTILMYRKTPEAYFDIEAVGSPRGAARRNHMRRGSDEDGRMYWAIRTAGKEYRYYDDELVYPTDVWDDIEHLQQRDPERTGFLTQKPEALLKRIIKACTREGDTVIDLFGGSGTAAAAAVKLGRRYVSCDKGAAALAVTRRRLIAEGMKRPLYEAAKPMTVQLMLPAGEAPDIEAIFDAAEAGGGLSLRVKDMPKDALPYYIAVGRVENGVFTASDYLLAPCPGNRLILPEGACVHVVDAGMREGYYELCE